MKQFFICCFIVICCNCFSQEIILNINDSNVRLRESPSLLGKIVLLMNINDPVTLIDVTDKYETIENVKSYWVHVKTKYNIIGYCFGKYVDISGKTEAMFYDLVYDKTKYQYRTNQIFSVDSKFKVNDLYGLWFFSYYLYMFFPDNTYTITFGPTHYESLPGESDIKKQNKYGVFRYIDGKLFLFKSVDISDEEINDIIKKDWYSVRINIFKDAKDWLILDYGGDGKGAKLY
jgi:hypothetical protein